MAGTIVSGMEWTIQKFSSLLLAATPASSSATPSEGATTALEDLKRLERTMKRIQSVLLDAHERDVRDHSEQLRLKELKVAAYDAEDVVGDYEYDVLHAKIQARDEMSGLDGSIPGQERILRKVIDLDSIRVCVPVSDEIAGRVKVIRERLEEITRDWETLWLSESSAPRRKNLNTMVRPPSSSIVQECTIHGRDEDRENIVKQLLSEDGSSKNGTLRVLAIVGMGGIGKTTVAQLVYNDARVYEHFELKGWVCVSENFDIQSLTRDVIESFTREHCSISQLDGLQSKLKERVRGKKFLLVLDDVWNNKPMLWNSFCVPLKFARSGTILVTARSSTVAKIMQTKPAYTLHHLNFDDCWSLFTQLVFDCEERHVDEHRIKIAKKIVARCCGLPLAVKAIGGVLCYEYDVESWIDILESKELGSNIRNGDFLPILKISYDHMPSHLKRCFAIFALFPKDYYFLEDRIIKLWMSVGLIHPDNGKQVEDTGRVYINELQERSMIQLQTRSSGEQRGFVIHDFLHDIAQQVAGDEFLRKDPKIEFDLLHPQTESPCHLTSQFRYLSVVQNSIGILNLQEFQGSVNLRVVQVLTSHQYNEVQVKIPCPVLESLRHLRALDLSNCIISDIPKSIGNLKLLRYLNLSKTSLRLLPESICNLYNLVTLELTDCPIEELPEGIRNLTNLRHLNCTRCWNLSCLPYGIGLLTNLQSLPLFLVGSSSSKCDLGELKDLKYLTGNLDIMGLKNVTNVNRAKKASLREKQYLQGLKLDWNNENCELEDKLFNISVELHEELLDDLKPHPKVRELMIKSYRGPKFSDWVGHSSFENLVHVKLLCFGCEQLPSLGQLPSLKILSINKGYNISYIGPEFIGCHAEIVGFQSLETLEFCRMNKFVKWFGMKDDDFPNLTKLKIQRCPQLTVIPTLPSLSYLHLSESLDEDLHISHMPQLRKMEVQWSGNIRTLHVSGHNFPSLQVLTIDDCRYLNSLDGLSSLTSLKVVTLSQCPELVVHPERDFPPSVEHKEITKCGQERNDNSFDQGFCSDDDIPSESSSKFRWYMTQRNRRTCLIQKQSIPRSSDSDEIRDDSTNDDLAQVKPKLGSTLLRMMRTQRRRATQRLKARSDPNSNDLSTRNDSTSEKT